MISGLIQINRIQFIAILEVVMMPSRDSRLQGVYSLDLARPKVNPIFDTFQPTEQLGGGLLTE
jgi:hypothetical protein